MRVFLLLILLSLIPQLALSHPTAFRGSKGIMGYHSPLLSHNQINYSFRHWIAAGVHHFKRIERTDNNTATMATANFLLKRWNGSNYQGNLYAVIGGGESHLSGQSKGTGLGLVQFDIEDRQYYFLAKHMQLINDEQVDLMQSNVRVGIAPYEDPYDGLHTWIILDYRNNKFGHEAAFDDLTPMLRVFYRNILFELGQSFRGITRFNYIAHF